jgi:hypothetical protein
MRTGMTWLIGRGLLAGAVGTVAMDAVWYRRAVAADETKSDFLTWEFKPETNGFDDAPAPARTARAVAERLHVPLDDRYAAPANNVVHWSTGVGWGVLASALAALPFVSGRRAGAVTGVVAWAASYAVLPRLGVYRPIGEYDRTTLWKDLSAHLVFGSACGTALALLGARRR